MSKSRTAFTVGFLASRSSKLDLMLIDFNELFFMKKPNREHGFSPFPKEARPCLSRNHNRASCGSKIVTLTKGKKKRKRVFFLIPRRHGRDSHESTTVPLASKTVTLTKEKKHVFSVSERHGRDSRESTPVPLAEAKP